MKFYGSNSYICNPKNEMRTTFRIQYNTAWGESLAVDIEDRLHEMEWGEGGLWSVSFDCPERALADYGYVVLRDGLVTRTEWDRHHEKQEQDSWIDSPWPQSPFPRRHSAAIFDAPGFRGAGTAIPVFSLRSEDDFGIGDFRDLELLVDWAAATGQCLIQLLPVNDTATSPKGSWDDSYPYRPSSSFALNPVYVRLQELGIKPDAAFRKLQKELNSSPTVDYPRVYDAKMEYSRKAFARSGAADLSTAAFKRWEKQNAFWLEEYALFCAARDGSDRDFYKWMQYRLDLQFSDVARYARSKGVFFKGDLPIGVGACSADAVCHPSLFNLGVSAGAPPDYFSADGQNWGFPTYNWDEMARDGYRWWRERLRRMSRWFDAFRIDHILGFFRIWEIPLEYSSGMYGHFNPALPYSGEEIAAAGLPLEGLFIEDMARKGWFHPLISPDTSKLEPWQKERFDALYWDFFYHRHDGFWRINACRKLPALLSATGMLACGEDLGMVPDCVKDVMDAEKILSMEMPCMDKGRPWPYLSVCATSGHDLETIRMQRLRESGADPTPGEARSLLWETLKSDSMLAVLPLQDWLAADPIRREDACAERINEPSNPHHHWCYRVHFPLERLASAESLNGTVAALVRDSGRNTR